MRKALAVLALFTAGALVLLLLVFSPVMSFIWQIASRERQLTNPAVYEPAALALARLLQSDPALLDNKQLSYQPPWLPSEVLGLEPNYVFTRENGITIEFGGGFHHFGYHLNRHEADPEDDVNHWLLEFYSEERTTRPLYAFSLPKSDRLDRRTFIDQALAEYHRRAGRRPDEDDVRSRVAFLLEHEGVEGAVQSVRDFAAAYPRSWLDQLLLFLIDGPTQPAARDRLEAWARREDDFSSWLLAAYAYDAAEDPDGVERCTRAALAHPPNDPDWMGYHARYRGAPMCLRLYRMGRFETCLNLAEALLGYQGAGSDYCEELMAIRNLAQQAAQGGCGDVNPPVLDMPFNPFAEIDLASLTGRVSGSPGQ